MSSTRLGPPMSRSGPIPAPKVGTGLAAALGTSNPQTPAAPPTLKPPAAAPRPAPHLVKPESLISHDSDVELLPLAHEHARVVYAPPVRPLWDLDRRDVIMLCLGGGGVIAAVGIGIFAAKFTSSKIRRGPDEDE